MSKTIPTRPSAMPTKTPARGLVPPGRSQSMRTIHSGTAATRSAASPVGTERQIGRFLERVQRNVRAGGADCFNLAELFTEQFAERICIGDAHFDEITVLARHIVNFQDLGDSHESAPGLLARERLFGAN